MPDSRRILPPSGSNAQQAAGQTGQAAIPRQIIAASLVVDTARVILDGTEALPQAIVAASARRRTVTVYYPSTDPITAAANSATVWVCGSPSDAEHAFPIEPGAVLELNSAGWLYGFTDGSTTPIVYVIAEVD